MQVFRRRRSTLKNESAAKEHPSNGPGRALASDAAPTAEYGEDECRERDYREKGLRMSKPTVLIAATSRWIPTARLAMALAQAGWAVDAVCPEGHPLATISGIRKIYPYRSLAPLPWLALAIQAARPELIIPGDDLATSHLHQLYFREAKRAQAGTKSGGPTGSHAGNQIGTSICELIERSLGSARSFAVVYARSAFIALARSAGVRAPQSQAIASLDELKDWIAQTGFPTVLKADGTSGGDGVRVVRHFEEAERAFRALQSPPSLLRAAKRALIDRDRTLLWAAALRRGFAVNAQEFAAGREATSAVACWQGKILASLHFEVLNKRNAAGPSSVLRRIENADMEYAAETMARELQLSGLHGFDFMLEASTGKAHLIEINPRATQVGHLTLGEGHDLPAALYAAVTGQAVQARPKITEKNVIALFPQEWMRDPESPFLQTSYHDVPWDEPELLRACAGKRKEQLAFNLQGNPRAALATAQLPRA